LSGLGIFQAKAAIEKHGRNMNFIKSVAYVERALGHSSTAPPGGTLQLFCSIARYGELEITETLIERESP
jgi:hypothetical protein